MQLTPRPCHPRTVPSSPITRRGARSGIIRASTAKILSQM